MMQWFDILIRAGSIGVLALLVYWMVGAAREQTTAFLAALSESSERCAEAMQARDAADALAAITNQTAAALADVRIVLAQQTEATRTNTALMADVKELLIRAERNGATR
jgi:conjugal transfer/entry exclusion protein